MSADIGLIGLAVMGSNLALNIAEKGHTIAVNNRTASRIDEFMATAKEQGLDSRIVHSFEDHTRSTARFANATARFGWYALDTAGPLDALVETTSSLVLGRMC